MVTPGILVNDAIKIRLLEAKCLTGSKRSQDDLEETTREGSVETAIIGMYAPAFYLFIRIGLTFNLEAVKFSLDIQVNSPGSVAQGRMDIR
jgi:hypothetical protein